MKGWGSPQCLDRQSAWCLLTRSDLDLVDPLAVSFCSLLVVVAPPFQRFVREGGLPTMRRERKVSWRLNRNGRPANGSGSAP